METRKSKRNRKEKRFGSDFYTCLVKDFPKRYSEAMTSSDASFWKEAMNSTMNSLLSDNSWYITDLPQGCKTM